MLRLRGSAPWDCKRCEPLMFVRNFQRVGSLWAGAGADIDEDVPDIALCQRSSCVKSEAHVSALRLCFLGDAWKILKICVRCSVMLDLSDQVVSIPSALECEACSYNLLLVAVGRGDMKILL